MNHLIIPDTFFAVNEELSLFLLSCLCGVFIGAVYDIFRTLRVIFPHNNTLVLIEDIVFLCGYAVFLTAFASVAARGHLRLYYIIGNGIGFSVYICTVGNIVISALRKLFSFFRKAAAVLFCPIKRICAFLCKKIHLEFVGNPKNLVKSLKNVKSLLRKRCGLLYNRMENKYRKNVKSVAEESKVPIKKEKGTVQQRSR